MKKLLFALGLLLPTVVFAQVSSNLWHLSGSQLIPNVSTWGITVPSLSNLTCIGTNGSGVFGAGTCSGGSSDPFTHPATGQSATTTLLLFFGNATSSEFEATSTVWLDNTKSVVLSTDANGLVGSALGSNWTWTGIQTFNSGSGTIFGDTTSIAGKINLKPGNGSGNFLWLSNDTNSPTSWVFSYGVTPGQNVTATLQSGTYPLFTVANASTTIFSSYGPAYFGATATSSFTRTGTLLVGTTSPTPSAALYVASTSTQPKANNIFTVASSTGGVLFNINGAGTVQIPGITSALITTDGSGNLSNYLGATSCGAHNFFTGFSASGASTCGTDTISGVSFGSNLNSLSNDGATLSGTSYNGSAGVSNWAINLGNGNIWTAASSTFVNGVTFGTSSTTNATTTKTSFAATSTANNAVFGGSASSTFQTGGEFLVGTTTTNNCGGFVVECVTATTTSAKTQVLFEVASSSGTALFKITGDGTTTIALFGTCTGGNALQTNSSGAISCGAVTPSANVTLGNYASSTGSSFSFSTTTTAFDGVTFGQNIVVTSGNLQFTPTFTGNFNSLSNDGTTLSGTSYNASAAVSNWAINLGNGNIWTAASTTFVNGVTMGKATTTNATTTASFFAATSTASNAVFGGTASSTFSATGQALIGTTTTSNCSQTTVLCISATSSNPFQFNLLTVASSTGKLLFTLNGAGGLSTYDPNNAWSGTTTPTKFLTLSESTTTTWTGTTTGAYVAHTNARFAGTIENAVCQATSTGAFLNVAFYITGTQITPDLIASTTEGTTTFTANNTFLAGAPIDMYVGSSTNSSKNIGVSCTLDLIQTS